MKTKIQISPEVREFNDAVENADVLTDYQFDTESVEVLTDRLAQTKAFPLSVEWLKNARAGIAVNHHQSRMKGK